MMTEKVEKKSEVRLIQSIQRATDILEFFAEMNTPLGISDFAKKLSLPKTTIQGIVTTLVELRYLEKDQHSAKYKLGPKLFQLGLSYATNMDLIKFAKVWMERMCFQFREPVNVGMLVGSKVLIIFRVEPEQRFMTFPQTGAVIPAHTTVIGKLLFAHMKESKREEVLRDYPFQKLTENSITSREEFDKELEKVREEGVAFDNEENIIGLAGIGAPIYNYSGQVIAAFVLSGNAEKINNSRNQIVNEVRITSRDVSEQLGYAGKKTAVDVAVYQNSFKRA